MQQQNKKTESLSKEVEKVHQLLQQLHFRRFSPLDKAKQDYLYGLLTSVKDIKKLEKPVKKHGSKDERNKLRDMSTLEKQEYYLMKAQAILKQLQENQEIEGPIFLRSRKLKSWKKRIITLKKQSMILEIREIDEEDKPNILDLKLFNIHNIGQKGKKHCILLEIKPENIKKVKHKDYLFGSDYYQETRQWFINMGGLNPDKQSQEDLCNKSILEQVDTDVIISTSPINNSPQKPRDSSNLQQIQISPDQQQLQQSIIINQQNQQQQQQAQQQQNINNQSAFTSKSQTVYFETQDDFLNDESYERKQLNQQQQSQSNSKNQNQNSFQPPPTQHSQLNKIKKTRTVDINRKIPFIFQSYYNEFDPSDAQNEIGYKCIDFKKGLRILQNQEKHNQFKLIMSLKGTPQQIIKAISEPEHFIQCNNNVQESNFIDLMRCDNSAIVYQKNKSIGAFYKSREFTFFRYVHPSEKNIIMFDKSIDYQMKGGYTVQAGEINSAIWLFTQHPDENDMTIMTLKLEQTNNGFGNTDQDAQITIAYLKSFENLQNYVTDVIKQQQQSQQTLSTAFSLEYKKQEEYEEIIPQVQNQITLQQIQEVDEEQENASKQRPTITINNLQQQQQQQQSLQYNNQQNQSSQQDLTPKNDLQTSFQETSNNDTNNIEINTIRSDNNLDEDSEQNIALEEELNRFAYNQIVLNAAMKKQAISENAEEFDKLQALVDANKHWQIAITHKDYTFEPISLQQKNDYKIQESNEKDGNYCFKKNWRKDQKTGQMYYINEEVIQKQKKVLKHLLKSIGGNIVTGKSVLSISMPVDIFDVRSNLERMADSFVFAPVYFEEAAKLPDPVEQMKRVVAFLLTTSLMYMDLTKPYNPILGETFQGSIKGCPIFMEQISHHPPILAFTLHGRGYLFSGYLESVANVHTNNFEGCNFGVVKVKFYNNQSEMIMVQPSGTVFNTVIGDRFLNLENRAFVIDKNNQLAAEILYNPDKKGTFSLGKQKTPADYFKGGIYKITDSCLNKLNTKYDKSKLYKLCSVGFKEKEDFAKQITDIEGYWDQELKIGGETFWHVDNGPFPYYLEPSAYPLPSDCNFRQDIIQLRKGDIQKAQQWKEKLEVIQRTDRKFRAKFAKQQKKKK